MQPYRPAGGVSARVACRWCSASDRSSGRRGRTIHRAFPPAVCRAFLTWSLPFSFGRPSGRRRVCHPAWLLPQFRSYPIGRAKSSMSGTRNDASWEKKKTGDYGAYRGHHSAEKPPRQREPKTACEADSSAWRSPFVFATCAIALVRPKAYRVYRSSALPHCGFYGLEKGPSREKSDKSLISLRSVMCRPRRWTRTRTPSSCLRCSWLLLPGAHRNNAPGPLCVRSGSTRSQASPAATRRQTEDTPSLSPPRRRTKRTGKASSAPPGGYNSAVDPQGIMALADLTPRPG